MGPFGENQEIKGYCEHKHGKQCIAGTSVQKTGRISKILFAFRLLQNSRRDSLGDQKHFTGESDIVWGGKGQVSEHTSDPADLRDAAAPLSWGRPGGTFSFEPNEKSQLTGERDGASAVVLWKAAKAHMYFLHPNNKHPRTGTNDTEKDCSDLGESWISGAEATLRARHTEQVLDP